VTKQLANYKAINNQF